MREEVQQSLGLVDIEDAILPLVSRPARYLPLILGLREPRRPASLEAVVAAPDLLEAAIMHPVVPALYHALADAGAAVEVAFLPWIDFEAELQHHDLPLFALKSRRALSEFDLIVIPVLRELQATGVLELLDLGRIPLFTADRSERDPVVVGSGPALANPEPLAPFFDAILVGDPEALIEDVVRTIGRFRRSGASNRADLHRALAALPGVYVPSAIEVAPNPEGELVAAAGTQPMVARYTDAVPLAVEPLQPLIEVRGDLFEVEVMRGCPRHCRFCQPARTAGPVRELTPRALRAAGERGVLSGGWDEMTLGGLMPADWSGLAPGAELLGRDLLGRGVALSLGAAAGERLNRSLLRELSRVRRTSLAFAPEAGSERLRRVIGKPLDEEALLRAVSEAAALGWPSVKLHFMIGLPTETDEDLVAIADLTERVRALGVRPGARFSVQVTVHPFVPRAHTPFQWEGQLGLEEMQQRVKRLRSLMRRRPLRLRWGRPEAAQLEALIARGDRRMAGAIAGAYRAGARLDGWSELLRPVLWWRACEEAGIDVDRRLGPRDPALPLPWSHLVLGEGESHFAAEREAARRGGDSLPLPPDPRRAMPKALGVIAGTSGSSSAPDPDPWPTMEDAPDEGPGGSASLYGRGRTRRRLSGIPSRRHRVRFEKTDPLRFISHLDVVRLMDRSLRRAGIALAYSAGYSRHPKLSFGPPLPVGMVGTDEFFDVELTEKRPAEFVDLLNLNLPEGVRILDAVPVLTKVQSLMSLIDHADYRLIFPPHARRLLGDPEPLPFRASLDEAIRHFLSHDRAYVRKLGPEGERPAEIRGGVRRLVTAFGDDAFPVLEVTLRITGEGAVRPLDLAGFLLGEDRLDPRLLRVERRRLFALRGDRALSPLEAAAGEEPLGALVAPADALASGAGRPDVQRDRHQRRTGRDTYRHSRGWRAG
jgi:radical SAM-linked protein